MPDVYHVPVLRDEALRFLQPKAEGIYVDGTVGGGGHASSIAEMLSPRGALIGFDRDAEALLAANDRLRHFRSTITLIHDSFASIPSQLRKLGIDAVDGVLLDLGVSSHQLDAQVRGFSFQAEGRLDMRMDQTQMLDAATVVNSYEAKTLADILRTFGEEPDARRIAKRIVESRKKQPILTTKDLADIVRAASGSRYLTKTLARVFQAIRIEVNAELEHLRKGLSGAIDVLRPGGRIVVLSYHSLEDRTVKNVFAVESRSSVPSGHKLIPDTPVRPRLELLTRKPLTASEKEIRQNPRARSAKLRAAERRAA